MKAQLIRRFGDPSVFEFTEVPTPSLRPGHVLVRVAATSVNQIDCKIRRGDVPALAPDLPAVLHSDVAGTVAAVGPGVSAFQEGDAVYGCAGGVKGLGGALAEYMLADARLLAKKPANLSMKEAAALPLVTITAWIALFEKAHIQKNQMVLIHGGLGGVGHIAVQLAKAFGAKVCTTIGDSAKNAEAKELGADEVVDYKKEDVTAYVQRLTAGKGFSKIFDTVGGKNLDLSLQAAALGGSVVGTAARSTHDLSPMHAKGLSLKIVNMLIPLLFEIGREGHGHILSQAAAFAGEGKLKPIVDPHTFSLKDAPEAHALLESGKAYGKIVIEVGH